MHSIHEVDPKSGRSRRGLWADSTLLRWTPSQGPPTTISKVDSVYLVWARQGLLGQAPSRRGTTLQGDASATPPAEGRQRVLTLRNGCVRQALAPVWSPAWQVPRGLCRSPAAEALRRPVPATLTSSDAGPTPGTSASGAGSPWISVPAAAVSGLRRALPPRSSGPLVPEGPSAIGERPRRRAVPAVRAAARRGVARADAGNALRPPSVAEETSAVLELGPARPSADPRANPRTRA